MLLTLVSSLPLVSLSAGEINPTGHRQTLPRKVVEDHAYTAISTPVKVHVLANDQGPWDSIDVTQPTNGVTQLVSDAILYTPRAGFLGKDEFLYVATDLAGQEFTANVTITVGSPLVGEDIFSATSGISRSIAVVNNDIGSWVQGSFSQPAIGTLSSNGGNLVYQSPNNFAGTDTFGYEVTDQSGVARFANVRVWVSEEPPPFVRPDRARTRMNIPVKVPILSNDVGEWTSGTLEQPSNGSVIVSDSLVIYHPDLNFVGVDTFSYTVTDSGGRTEAASVEITVGSTVAFTDVTAASGLTHQQSRLSDSLMSPECFSCMTGGGAAGDFDGDGWVDLYVTLLDAPDILYRNVNGSFMDVTAESGIDRVHGSNGAGWADIDNDGDLDLYTTSIFDSRFYLFINEGGVFTEEAVIRSAHVPGEPGRRDHFGMSVSFGDYNLDGFLDLHVGEWRSIGSRTSVDPSHARLLQNVGVANPGHFRDVTVAAGVSLDGYPSIGHVGTFAFTPRFADFDQDGWLDLALAGDFGESRLFWNQGDGTFVDGTHVAGVGTDQNGMGSAIADIDGDGDLDWFVSSIFDPDPAVAWGTTGNRLYRNDGDRQFSDITDLAGVRNGYWGWGSVFFDHDNDGDPDLLQTNGFDRIGVAETSDEDDFERDPTRFWDNDGSGRFTESSWLVGITDESSGKGALTFDFDNDGDLDVLILNTGHTANLYRNDGGNSNDWLRVSARGPGNGVGARVEVTPIQGGTVAVQWIDASSGFLAQSESVAHFGLGPNRQELHRVSIIWPDGKVETRNNVSPRQHLVFDHSMATLSSTLRGGPSQEPPRRRETR